MCLILPQSDRKAAGDTSVQISFQLDLFCFMYLVLSLLQSYLLTCKKCYINTVYLLLLNWGTTWLLSTSHFITQLQTLRLLCDKLNTCFLSVIPNTDVKPSLWGERGTKRTAGCPCLVSSALTDFCSRMQQQVKLSDLHPSILSISILF